MNTARYPDRPEFWVTPPVDFLIAMAFMGNPKVKAVKKKGKKK